MATRPRCVPVQWKLLLPVFGLLLALIASPAHAAETLDAPLVAGAPDVDGDDTEAFWTDAATDTYTFDGTLREERTREVTLRAAHNGTHLFFAARFTPGGGMHDADHFLVTFYDGAAEAIPAGGGDYLRYGGTIPPSASDRHWNGTAWVVDQGGCTQQGSGARSDVDGAWQYELVKPLEGDGCDLHVGRGDTLWVRFELRENRPAPDHGDDFRWPRGSSYLDAAGNQDGRLDEVQGWARLTLLEGAKAGASTTEPTSPGGNTHDPTTSTDGDKAGGNGAAPGSDASGEDAAAESSAPGLLVVLSLTVVASLAHARTRRRL